jgi:hypothetical protein
MSMKLRSMICGTLLCIAHTACADQHADYAEIVRQAADVVAREDGPIAALIAPSDIEDTLLATLRNVRKVVPRSAVPAAKKYTLPKGYLLIERVEFAPEDDSAKFFGIVGPGALKGTLGADVDCGRRYVILFWQKEGKWANGPYKTQDCSVDDEKK